MLKRLLALASDAAAAHQQAIQTANKWDFIERRARAAIESAFALGG